MQNLLNGIIAHQLILLTVARHLTSNKQATIQIHELTADLRKPPLHLKGTGADGSALFHTVTAMSNLQNKNKCISKSNQVDLRQGPSSFAGGDVDKKTTVEYRNQFLWPSQKCHETLAVRLARLSRSTRRQWEVSDSSGQGVGVTDSEGNWCWQFQKQTLWQFEKPRPTFFFEAYRNWVLLFFVLNYFSTCSFQQDI